MSLADIIARIKGETVTTGIDVGHYAIKLAKVEHSKGARRLLAVDMEQLPVGTFVDNEIKELNAFKEAMVRIMGRNFPHGPSGDLVVSMNWSNGILADRIHLKKVDEHDNEAFIIAEASKRSPFDEPGVILDYEVLGDTENGEQDVLIVAAKETALDNWAKLFDNEGIRPVALDVDAFAVVNTFLLSATSQELEQTVAIMSIGEKKSHISFVRKGRYLSTREVQNASVSDFLSSICRRLGMNQETAGQILRGEKTDGFPKDLYQQSLEYAAEEYGVTVELALRYYTSSENQDKVQRLIMTGGGASIPGLAEFLGKKLEIETGNLNPFAPRKADDNRTDHILYDSQMFGDGLSDDVINLLTTALGLALRKF